MSPSKRVPQGRRRHYTFEAVEPRRLLSVSAADVAAIAAVPSGLRSQLFVHLGATARPDYGLSGPVPGTITVAQMRGAYGITGTGAGQTIAIVDAYDDPFAATDLDAFDAQYGLPAPASLRKVDQYGAAVTATSPGDTSIDGTDPADDTVETSLDMEWAHAIAPDAGIILVECNSLFNTDLDTGIATASTLPGVSAVSMSFGSSEYAGETSSDVLFTTPFAHQGVTFVASAGDTGIYAPGEASPIVSPQYPASSANVVAVGGTNLIVDPGNLYGGETGWGNGTDSYLPTDAGGNPLGGGGGGVSQYEPAPDYQTFVTDNLGGGMRTYPDVAMEGGPDRGVSVVDSFYTQSQITPWIPGNIYGTSLSAPMFAGVIADANQQRVAAGRTTLDGPSQTLPHLYEMPGDAFHDVTVGNNGDPAGVGYDLVTGRGSPVGDIMIRDLAANYVGYHVFDDVNADGVQEPGEGGVGGVAVSLETQTGVVLQTTATDADGFYQFLSPVPGDYVVHFTTPGQFLISPVGTASDRLLDNNVDPTNGNAAVAITGTGPTVGTSDYPFADCGLFRETVSVANSSVSRPQSGVVDMTFTVTVSPVPSTLTFTVPYTTVDGTASDVTPTTGPATVANGDYTATAGTLTFGPGVAAETISVPILGNARIEKDLVFAVQLTPPPTEFDVTNSTTAATGTIVNTSFPAVSVATAPSDTVTRSATAQQTIEFPVTLSAPAPFPVTVNYATSDLSAFGGADYQATSGALVFTPDPITGLTPTVQDVPVIVYPGTNRQLDKTFLLNVTGSATAVTGLPAQATGTILTNVPPAVSVEPGVVTESLTGTSLLPFQVDVGPSLTGPVTVSYTTADGTGPNAAVAGVDYTAVSGTLTFAPGRIQQTVYVPVYRQFLSATTKTLTFTISNPSVPIDLVSPSVTGTITYLPVTTLPFDKTKRASYTDNLGQRVTVSLAGPGSGTLVFLGNNPVATNAFELAMSGTTSATTVAVGVSGTGQTTVGSIEVDGSLNALSAKDLNVQGAAANVTVSGSIGSLNLGYLSQATIGLGGTPTGHGVAINLRRAVDTTITSAAPIKSLTAGAYINTTPATPDLITVPSVGPIHVTGNFGGHVQASGMVAALVVGGVMSGSIEAGGGIGSVVAGSLSGASLLAGTDSGAGSLAATTFSNTAASIGRVQVRSTFSDSVIAGSTVGRVTLGSVTSGTSGTPFGIVGSHIASLRTTVVADGAAVSVSNPKTKLQYGDFVVDPL